MDADSERHSHSESQTGLWHYWDIRAKISEFDKGDKVFMQKPERTTELSDSWAGPCEVLKKKSTLSYRLHTGYRVIGLVHIGLLKKYVPRNPEPTIKRVTTILKPDTESDSMDQQFTELVIRGTDSQTTGNTK